MRVVDCVQGDDRWHEARVGLPTASQFGRLVTPGGKPSSQADRYLYALVAERLLGRPVEYESGWMARGSAFESEAVAYYELVRGVDVEPVGFVLTDDGRAGASPDRLVGGDGLAEIKCPTAAVHVGYLLGEDAAQYRPQVQGQLWVTGRKWVDWLSYCPELPPALVRHERDEQYIATLAEAVTKFCAEVDRAHERLLSLMRAVA